MLLSKIKTLTAAAVFAFAAIPTGTLANEKNDMPPGQVFGIGKYKDVIFPQAHGRSFTLGQVGITSGLDLSCSGLGEYNIFSNLGSEVTRAFNYIKGNAAGLAINYLIYSRPTLYQLYQNLNTHLDFAKELSSLSCSSIIANATEKRKGLMMDAKDECIADGKPANDCDDPSVLRSYISPAYFDLKHEAKGIVSQGYEDAKNVVLELFDQQQGNPTGSGVIDDEKGDIKDLLKEILGKRILNSNGDVQISLPETKAHQIIKEESTKFSRAIDTVISAPPSSTNREDGWLFLNNLPYVKALNAETIVKLTNLKSERPAEYNAAVSQLANTMAFSTIRWRVSKIRTFLHRQAVSNNTDKPPLSDDDMQHLFLNLQAFEAELAEFQVLEENKLEQADIEYRIEHGYDKTLK